MSEGFRRLVQDPSLTHRARSRVAAPAKPASRALAARLYDAVVGSLEATVQASRSRRLGIVVALAALHAFLGTFCLAPFGQFYLAYAAVVPVMWLAVTTRSWKAAAGGGYLAGLGYYGANLWYLWFIGVGPLVGSVVYLAFYTAAFAVVLRVIASQPPARMALLAAAAWVGLDWVRGTFGFALPYLYLGHSQLPLTAMTQVADAVGTWGVTFWVVLVNATIFAVLRHGGARPGGRQLTSPPQPASPSPPTAPGGSRSSRQRWVRV